MNGDICRNEKGARPGAVRFTADGTLGKLAKWLRLLGYDTVFHRGRAEKAFLLAAEREGRVVLTRMEKLGDRQFQGRLLVVRADRVEDQIGEVLAALGLPVNEGDLFRLCLRCNEPLLEIPRVEVEGRVPAYVFENRTTFRTCPVCGGVYWPGTHSECARRGLIARILTRLP